MLGVWRTVSVNGLLGWPSGVGNHLKIFDAAVDETRGRLYVQGILTSGIAVIDTASNALIGRLESGIGVDNFHRTYLAVSSTTGDVYVADYSNETLRRIDPDSGAITGPVALDGRPEHMLVDGAANRVYLSLKTSHTVAVFDASSLAPIGQVDVARAWPLGMALDAPSGRLYVVDSRPPADSGVSHLLVVDTARLREEPPIVVANPTGRPLEFVDLDPAGGWFYITTPEDLFKLDSGGTAEWITSLPDDAKAPRYWDATGKVYVISRNGLSSTRSTLAVVDGATGTLERTVDLGTGGAQRMGFDSATGTIYTPGMQSTNVVAVDARTATVVTSIDIGNSVEGIAVAPDDGTLYLANRLGGSTLVAYRPDDGAWTEISTGGWPTGVDVDPALDRLFVLSHYDGAVTAYDLAADSLHPQLVGSVSLGFTDSTDALSAQALDATHHRVVTTHPEHGKVVIIDGNTLQVIQTIDRIPSFTADPAKISGAGHLEPAVDEGLDKLYVLVRDARKVDVFDGDNGYAFVHTIDLSAFPWDPTLNDRLVRVDSERHRLYVGLSIIDTLTDTRIGQLPEGAGLDVVGVDATANRLYSLGVDGTTTALWELDRDTLSVVGERSLRPLDYVPPLVVCDAARGRVAVGFMQPAEVDILAPSTSSGPRAAFLAIHTDLGGDDMAAEWDMLDELVARAASWGFRLTLEFRPEWAAYAEQDPSRLAQVRAWEAAGHEIALHHHGLSHPEWDGYTDAPGHTHDPRYRGTMADALALVAGLSANGSITTAGMTDETTDWIAPLRLTTGGAGKAGGALLSVPTAVSYRGIAVTEVLNRGYAMDKGPTASLDEIRQAIVSASPDEVLGIVTHPYDFGRDPAAFDDLFATLAAAGVRLTTVRSILEPAGRRGARRLAEGRGVSRGEDLLTSDLLTLVEDVICLEWDNFLSVAV